MCNVESRRAARTLAAGVALALGRRAFPLLAFGIALLPLPAASQQKPPEKSGEIWPAAVQARYRLRYNGIEVGKVDLKLNTSGNTYSISGSGKVSVLFGSVVWAASSTVSGTIEDGEPLPANYAFDWRNNKKRGTIRISYLDHIAAQIAVRPPTRERRDTVPLRQGDKVALDPVSAIMMLTKADARPPCDRRVGIFDGKQRYDIVFTPKRLTRLPAPRGGGSEVAYVCRITYEPISGHRANADTKEYAANRDVELVLRRIPHSQMLIPYSLSVPTPWGTGTMVTERIDISSATAGKIALTD
ncbi:MULTISPECIES: DUF3108 domain-containing protein [Rhodomicrobium]|uniref:DUF3108 domain-containing protein n=1 Tax=Rhodomicrobium TaxID=1068 RepID=UPI001595547D|nr:MULTISPECIES: DUF3108 domain-containing protein [Rhodomicrobium]